MPKDSQRVMLFEKLQFFSEIKKGEYEDAMKKKEITETEVKRIESETKKWHSENETLLKNIKDLYSRKLPLLKQQKLNAKNKGEKESPLKLRMVKAVSFKEENKNQAA